jgi:hypothetical protein
MNTKLESDGAPNRAGGTSVGPGSTDLANRPSAAAQPATTGQLTCTPVRKQLGRQGGEDIVCLRFYAIEMLFSQILRFQHLTNQFIGRQHKTLSGIKPPHLKTVQDHIHS